MGRSVAVRAAALRGVEAIPVTVEVSPGGGVPGFIITGGSDNPIFDAAVRVRCAMRECGFEIPQVRYTVNLAPADMKKGGTAYDLAIAVAILIASGQIPPRVADGAVFAGELALNGCVEPVRGAAAYASLAASGGLDLIASSRTPAFGGELSNIVGIESLSQLKGGLEGLRRIVGDFDENTQ